MTWSAALTAAQAAIDATYGEPITVGSTVGRGVITPENGAMLGGGIEIRNGARLAVIAADFPSLAVNAAVTRGADSFVLVEIDPAVDAAGYRHGLMARA